MPLTAALQALAERVDAQALQIAELRRELETQLVRIGQMQVVIDRCLEGVEKMTPRR